MNTPNNSDQTFDSLLIKAEAGCTATQVAVGLAYLHGHGVEKNERQALTYFAKSAQAGNPYGCLHLSLFCLEHKAFLPPEMLGQATELAVNGLATASQAGIPLALYNLGLMFLKGDGVSVDAEKARVCFETGAQAQDADCQVELAIMMQAGEGGDTDPVGAFRLASLAAAAGSAKGQFLLGCYYAQGTGVAANEQEAMRFIGMAAAQQYQPALDMLSDLGASRH